MSDVRLTATNPEDSSAVPVACNSKGELLLEEIPDQSFNGNLEGDLSVTGNAVFTGELDVGDYKSGIAGKNGFQLRKTGELVQNSNGGDAYTLYSNSSNKTITFQSGGSATFSGDLFIQDSSYIRVRRSGDNTSTAILLAPDGAAACASGKAGFTADGNLWCTTVRGDTVMLDATSNGLGAWVAYTPPTRKELLEEKITDIRDAAIKPSQDLPETDADTQ